MTVDMHSAGYSLEVFLTSSEITDKKRNYMHSMHSSLTVMFWDVLPVFGSVTRMLLEEEFEWYP